MARILIVDDDEEICRNLSEVLKEDGYEVEYVTSGMEALDKVTKEKYDIVITDLVMPKISGMDVLSYIKRESPETEVVMITAFGSIENAVEAMKRGASDYIEKPFKLNEIRTSIKRVLEEAKFKREHEKLITKETEDVGKILKNIANPIRRKALMLLYTRRKMSFKNLRNELGIEDPTKLSFHLKQLKESDLVAQNADREYLITARGEKVIRLLQSFRAI